MEFRNFQQPLRPCKAFAKGQCSGCNLLHVSTKTELRAVIEPATQNGFEVADVTYKAAGLPVPPELILKRIQDLNAQGMAKLEAITMIISRLEGILDP